MSGIISGRECFSLGSQGLDLIPANKTLQRTDYSRAWSKVISLRDRGGKEEYDSRVLGSGGFVERVLREADENLARQIRHRPRKSSIKEVVEKMCGEAGVEVEELRRGNQRRRVAEVRAKVAYELNRKMGISMAEIARHLGVGASAIAMAIRKAEREKLL